MSHTQAADSKNQSDLKTVEFGCQFLTLEQVVAVAKGAPVKLCDDADYQEYIQKVRALSIACCTKKAWFMV